MAETTDKLEKVPLLSPEEEEKEEDADHKMIPTEEPPAFETPLDAFPQIIRFVAFIVLFLWYLWMLYEGEHIELPAISTALEVFEVYKPLDRPDASCQAVLMEHSFGWSYGKPFVGTYAPPTECDWTHVSFTLSFESQGVQFDRLALLFLDDVEIWRTSTAEPTWQGIHWEYEKDMTKYRSLLRKKGKIILELGNLVDEKYTGAFNGTLTATYYTKSEEEDSYAPDEVLPLSRCKSADDQPSAFSIPRDNASTTIFFPKHHYSKAIISLTASGNAEEEFWYTNVPTHLKYTYGTPLLAHSPFREVQLLLDGQLVGVAWPFPVIFTGGISPGLWRPIVGIATFDLVEDEIDVTPWIHLFADGHSHTWEVRVLGIHEDGVRENGDPKYVIGGHIGNDWIVSGRLLLWSSTGTNDTTTTAVSHPKISHETVPSVHLAYELVKNSTNDANLTLVVALSVQRLTTTEYGEFNTSHALSFSSISQTTNNGLNQTVDQFTQSSFHYSTAFNSSVLHTKYPLNVTNNVVVKDDGFTIVAEVDRTLHRHIFKEGEEEGEKINSIRLETRQNGTSTYVAPPPGVGGGWSFGMTEQVYNLTSPEEEYLRHVKAIGGYVVKDETEFDGFTLVNCIKKFHNQDEGVGNIGWNDRMGRLEVRKMAKFVQEARAR